MRSVRFATGPNRTGIGSTLFDAESGVEIHGVSRIVATVTPDDLTVVEAEFVCAEVDVHGALSAVVIDPASGERKQVAKIVYSDGTEWEA